MNKALLPKVAKPVRYQVKLDVDLDNFNYKGSQIVELEMIEETSSFEVNAIDIEITHAYLLDTMEARIDLDIEYLKDLERISFRAEDSLAIGTYSLNLEFTSSITNDLKGFYKSQFLDFE